MKIYKTSCILAALLFLFLFYTLQFEPSKLCQDLGLEANDVADFLARRASMLMLGFGVLLLFAVKIKERKSIMAVSLGVGVCMCGLACMSAQELFRGFVNSGMVAPLIIEAVVGVSFLTIGLLQFKNENNHERSIK